MTEAKLTEIVKAYGDQLAAEKPLPVVTVSVVPSRNEEMVGKEVRYIDVFCVLVAFKGGQFEAARIDPAAKSAEKDLQEQLKNVKAHAAQIRQMAQK